MKVKHGEARKFPACWQQNRRPEEKKTCRGPAKKQCVTEWPGKYMKVPGKSEWTVDRWDTRRWRRDYPKVAVNARMTLGPNNTLKSYRILQVTMVIYGDYSLVTMGDQDYASPFAAAPWRVVDADPARARLGPPKGPWVMRSQGRPTASAACHLRSMPCHWATKLFLTRPAPGNIQALESLNKSFLVVLSIWNRCIWNKTFWVAKVVNDEELSAREEHSEEVQHPPCSEAGDKVEDLKLNL